MISTIKPKLLKSLPLALCLAVLAAPAAAQIGTRAYAPENIAGLNYNDQVRVISLEYQEQSNGRRIPEDQLRFYLDQVNRSNWGFSQIKNDIAQSLGGGGGWNPQPGGGNAIRCESIKGRSSTCRTPWQGQSRLTRQLSNTACVEGRTWQSQRGQVFVSGGCRAEFGPGRGQNRPPYPGQGGQSVTCSSVDNRTVTCAWPPGYGAPRLIEQLSRTPCVQGRTWGISSRTAIWVGNGCRGRFGN